MVRFRANSLISSAGNGLIKNSLSLHTHEKQISTRETARRRPYARECPRSPDFGQRQENWFSSIGGAGPETLLMGIRRRDSLAGITIKFLLVSPAAAALHVSAARFTDPLADRKIHCFRFPIHSNHD